MNCLSVYFRLYNNQYLFSKVELKITRFVKKKKKKKKLNHSVINPKPPFGIREN